MRTLTTIIALICCLAGILESRAQAIASTNHTVVRFDVFAAGTNFGKLDIELFDQEKPETVRNFLLYVYSGGYSNLVLHRLVPNFVLQAGHVRVANPTSAAAFTSYLVGPTFGEITNEYGIGPELTNGFGTIAMARISGQTNSAETDWFINLADNPALDTVDGGFTVFGQVVNTMDERSGTNLLAYFNSLSSGNGIRSTVISSPSESLSSLPVTTNRVGSPQYADLFTVRTSFVQGGMLLDDMAPSIAVTQPADASITTTNASMTIVGTAADNQQVARVLYDAAGGNSLVASGTTNWSVELPLNWGTNHFSVRSVDYFGNVSSTVEREIVRRTPPPDPNHTVVRFDVFAGGTNFGKLDIELFDQEKPETVRNFLTYVYSGAYSNLVLHRLVRHFVLQAGHIRVADPASPDAFSSYPVSSNFGTITNEYGSGPQLANSFSTVAMARLPGQTNSASTDWFINLADNPPLNTNDGGFTVFGRVVNEMDDRSGINLLGYFNTSSSGLAIRSASITDPVEVLSNLPVTTNRGGQPHYADLFTVRASFVQGGMPRDNSPPTTRVTQPANASINTTNASLTILGTAADNQQVARVLYDSASGESLVAQGTTNWSVELPLEYGTNHFSVRSVDYFGNVSPPVEREIVRRTPPPDPNHTVVRFDVFAGGTNFGRLDIELFDQEKPETVRNFLIYLYSGAYSNIVLHRLLPNFVLQAGHVRNTNESSTAAFYNYPPWPDFGRVTNEFSVGPQLANDFGTVAMARIPGQTNSASIDWFINMTNNATLNTNDGGFTVFGRVVNETDQRSGVFLLNYFNTFSKLTLTNVGQVVFTNGIGFAGTVYGELLFDLPVITLRANGAVYADLITIRPSFLQGGSARDNVAPIVQVNDPPGGAVVVTTNSSIMFSGTAADNQAVARVLYDAPSGSAMPVNGTGNWTAEVPLVGGTNEITIRGVDYFGNVGSAERTVFLSHTRSVALSLQGKGTVAGITNGQSFLVGVNYTLTAKPGARQYFLGWRDGNNNVLSADRTFNFTMQESTTNIVAIFSRTILGITNGPYKGLFFSGTNGPSRSAGVIAMNIAANGFYSGRLAPLGASYIIRGKFDNFGRSAISGQRGADTLVLGLAFTTEESVFGNYADGHSLSGVGLWHVEKFSTANPSPQAGTYTFLVSPSLDTQLAVVGGYGFGSVIIDPLGRIKMKGILADGAAVRQKSAILANNLWTFFASAKAGREVVLGVAGFGSNNVINADVKMFSADFPGKTNQNAHLSGSPYVPPSQARLFNWTNGVITLSGGGLPAAVFASVVLNGDGSFAIPSNPNNIQMNAPDATGAIAGSFIHPVTAALTPLRGAVLQSSNMAAGFFPGGTSSGAFTIRGQ